MQLVFFDLDGTITRRDTLVDYLAGLLWRRPWRALRLLRMLPAAWRFLTAGRDAGALKGALIQSVAGGLTRAELDAWTRAWLPGLLARGVFADARRAIDGHRSQGDRLVLMSASVDLYVPAIGAALGFDEVICSRVLWHGDRLVGTLVGENCRDVEKLRQLRRLRADHPDARTIAYGNSAHDLPHLDAADQGWCINATGRLREDCDQRGVHVIEWK